MGSFLNFLKFSERKKGPRPFSFAPVLSGESLLKVVDDDMAVVRLMEIGLGHQEQRGYTIHLFDAPT